MLIEIGSNWRDFKEAADDAELVMYHATSLASAERIWEDGFRDPEGDRDAMWSDSERGFVYVAGDVYGLGTYLRHARNAIVKVVVRKVDLVADDTGVDWLEYVRLNRAELKRDGVDLGNVTANDTFKYIGQVKARYEDVRVVDYYEY